MLPKAETVRAPGMLSRITRFPITRIVLAAAFVIAGVVLAQIFAQLLSRTIGGALGDVLSVLVALAAAYFAYRWYVRLIERRPLTELALEDAVSETGKGLLIGLALVTVLIAILWLAGSYRVIRLNPFAVLLPAAVANIPSGFVQEILFRGILFRITRDSLGTWIALGVSSILFGLVHIFTANATVISTVSVILNGGVLLAAAYILTGRLWLAIGIHIAWDIALDGIFGVGALGATGQSMQGLLMAQVSGPEWLTGGVNGVEVSLVATLLALGIAILLLVRGYRQGRT